MLDQARGAGRVGSQVCVATSQKANAGEAIAELKVRIGETRFAQIIVFFSPLLDANELARALAEAFPGVSICGCSSAGEITAGGFVEDGLLFVGFPACHFKVVCGLIENIHDIGFEEAFQDCRTLRARLLSEGGSSKEHRFGLMFVDGLSNCEEQLIAAVHSAIHDFPLVGGSAGDGLAFRKTSLIYGDRAITGAAVVVLFDTDLEFRVFRTQNFEPTSTKLVVTAADVEKRIVHELNAEPASIEYAAAIGLQPDALTPMSFASHPVVVKIGPEYYCRSIRNVNDDGSLTFFCAIDEGLVLTVAEPKDIVDCTRDTLEAIKRDLGDTAVTLGFECVLRRLDAESTQARRDIEQLYRDYNVIGFHTYGEQFNAMHLNQTLTGIAIGASANDEHS